MLRNNCTRFLALLAIAAPILYRPPAVLAQVVNVDPEARIVEPIVTEETMPNEPGDWDLRLSGSYMRDGTARSGFLPSAQLFFGIAERWGGEVQVPLAFVRDGTNHYGLGDVSTSLKYLVRKPGGHLPGLVLGIEATFPSGNTEKRLGEGVFEAAPLVAIVKASQQAVLQGNVGYAAVHKIRETDATNQLFYNGAAAFRVQPLNGWFVGEINGTHGSGENRIALSPGWKYDLAPERFLAVAFPIGLNSQTPRIGIILQMQFTLRSATQQKGEAR